jgi:hypothetical protein
VGRRGRFARREGTDTKAGCFDVAHGDQGLGLRGANRHDHADAVACGIIDLCELCEPALAVVELRRSEYGAAV